MEVTIRHNFTNALQQACISAALNSVRPPLVSLHFSSQLNASGP